MGGVVLLSPVILLLKEQELEDKGQKVLRRSLPRTLGMHVDSEGLCTAYLKLVREVIKRKKH